MQSSSKKQASTNIEGTDRFKSAIPGKKVVVEVFDIQKAKQIVNDMINDINTNYPEGAADWIEKEMSYFTSETSAIDAAMAAAISQCKMTELKKQIKAYFEIHMNAFSAFGSYRDLVDEKLARGLFNVD